MCHNTYYKSGTNGQEFLYLAQMCMYGGTDIAAWT